MGRLGLRVLVLALLAPCFSAVAVAQSRHMQMLAPGVGWALWENKLFWTSNNGSEWANITPQLSMPRERIVDVYFKDPYQGWVLLAAEVKDSGLYSFEVAATMNSGTTWSTAPVDIPERYRVPTVLDGAGRVDFVDSAHGWLNLNVTSSSNFNSAIILITVDGGATWKQPVRGAWAAGRLLFATENLGWLAGGPGGQHLYATHDGGRTWEETVLEAPPSAGAAKYPLYDVPTFTDPSHGFLPVTYTAPDDLSWALVLFATADGGRTWRPYKILTGIAGIGGVLLPSQVTDSRWVTATATRSDITVKESSLGTQGCGGPETATAAFPDLSPPLMEMSFASPSSGWIRLGRLLATSDGGASWREISPWRGKGRRTSKRVDLGSGAAGSASPTILAIPFAAGGGGATTHTSVHLGFDQCSAAISTEMQTWWTSSPYYDTYIYIGGVSRNCPQLNLKKSWVSAVTRQGWGVVPAWVGPQAPCACDPNLPGTCPPFPHVFSSDPGTAATQAVYEADSATSAAASLGLGQTIIYYDMENYDAAQCGDAVDAFINSWVNELHLDGYLAGVYGNAGDAGDWWSLGSKPDDVWIARYDSRATTWGLAHGLSSPDGILDSMWTNNQRAHQYRGNVTEKWGGTAFAVDKDIEAATVAGAQGTRTPGSYNFSTVNYTGAPYTQAMGANESAGDLSGGQMDQIVGPPGFLETGGGFAAITCPGGAPRPYAPIGINNQGQAVGTCNLTDGTSSAFIFEGGASTLFTYPQAASSGAAGINDAGQIVGWYTDASGKHGFVYNYGGDGTFDSFQISGGGYSYDTEFRAINGQGQIIGTYLGPSYPGSTVHSFLWNRTSDGSLVSLDEPGATNTYIQGINANGQIVG